MLKSLAHSLQHFFKSRLNTRTGLTSHTIEKEIDWEAIPSV